MRFDHHLFCAVIVTYFPPIDILKLLRRISGQVGHIIVVDNSGAARLPVIDRIQSEFSGIEIIRNQSNMGIAKALNQGIKNALLNKFDWIATFDQDSLPESDLIAKLHNAWKRHIQSESIMIVGANPTLRNFIGSRKSKNELTGTKMVPHVITSGSITRAESFRRAGFYDEALFIDFVDIEYCLRIRNKGFRVIQVGNAVMDHSLGNIQSRLLAGRRVHPSHHPPIRRYYQFRNGILIFKAYRKQFPVECRSYLSILSKIACLILIYEKKRLPKIVQLAKGVLHGLQNRAGVKGERSYHIPVS